MPLAPPLPSIITPRFWILFWALITYCPGVHAAKLFVATNGAKTNPGTLALLKATVQAAIDAASDNDSVLVPPAPMQSLFT